MALLEIVAAGSDVLQAAYAVQRARLEQTTPVVTVSFLGMPSKDRAEVLKKLGHLKEPAEGILLRGAALLHEVVEHKPKDVPLFLDHISPVEFGATSPLRRALAKVTRAYCYSALADEGLRQAGLGRLTVVQGPVLPPDYAKDASDKVRVAVLATSSQSSDVLIRLWKMRETQGWPIEIVSPLRNSNATRVANNFEAAEAAEVIIAPYEDKDFGEPHEGAILALALGRPLITVRTSASLVTGFPERNVIWAKKYVPGSYAVAVGVYLKSRKQYDEWDRDTVPNPYTLPDDLLSRL